MLLSLEKSDTFQNEYKDFTNRAHSIKDPAVSSHVLALCKNLQNQVKLLDQAHAELSLNNKLSSSINEIKLTISKIRKEIFKKLKENNV